MKKQQIKKQNEDINEDDAKKEDVDMKEIVDGITLETQIPREYDETRIPRLEDVEDDEGEQEDQAAAQRGNVGQRPLILVIIYLWFVVAERISATNWSSGVSD